MAVVYPELTELWRRQVRLIIGDLGAPQLFTDGNLDEFHALEYGNVKRAAAQALDTVASSEALLSKKITSSTGTSTDGPAVAKSLRDHAAALRSQAAEEDAVVVPCEPDPTDEFYFGVAEFQPSSGPEGSERGYW